MMPRPELTAEEQKCFSCPVPMDRCQGWAGRDACPTLKAWNMRETKRIAQRDEIIGAFWDQEVDGWAT